jgi:hypothetical protein
LKSPAPRARRGGRETASLTAGEVAVLDLLQRRAARETRRRAS